MNKFAASVRWLWLHRDMETAFDISLLTESHRVNDSSIPSPALTNLESKDLFRLLEKKELVFPHNIAGTYLLNKVEEYKWTDFISELELPNWRRSRWYKHLCNVICVVLAALIGGFVGGYVQAMGGKAADLTVDVARQHSTEANAQPEQAEKSPSHPAEKK